MARLAIAAVAGVAAGYLTDSPQVGFAVFSAVYGLTAPPQKVQGPRLDDLKAPQATYGTEIPVIEGAPRMAGIYVWYSDKREVANTQEEGKGGGVQSTTFTYEMDALILLAGNQCAGIRRVFSFGKLVWSKADDADLASRRASRNTDSWREIRFYGGADDQLPDPIYEAAVGVGNAPAYRGSSTVFIEGLNLGNSGQVPILTFEVLSEADEEVAIDTLATLPMITPFACGTPAYSAAGFTALIGQWDNSYATPDVMKFDVDGDGNVTQTSAFGVDGTDIGPCAIGNSDESCLLAQGILTATQFGYYDADGVRTVIDPGENLGNNHACFSKVGTALVMGSSAFGSKKVHRFLVPGGGSPVASSSALASYVQAIAIGSGHVYALADASSTIYDLNLTTLALNGTITAPDAQSNSSILCDEDGRLHYLTSSVGGRLYAWDGSAWTGPQTIGTAIIGTSTWNYGMSGGELFSQVPELPNVVIRTTGTTLAIVAPGLDQVVERVCERAGMVSAQLDVTSLASDHVRAIAMTGTARQALELLMAGYLFESVESGDVLRFVKRGGAAVATLPYEDLGAAAGDATVEPLPRRRLNDLELPARLTVKYANVLNDFQDGAETGDRLITQSTQVQLIELPIGFTPTEAKRLVDANTMDLAVGMLAIGPVSLPRKYSLLEPTDVVSLTGPDGSVYRTRIGKTDTADGISTHQLVLDDATAIDSIVSTDEDYDSSSLVRSVSQTTLELLDIPILRDVDNTPGFYAAFNGGDIWPGAELDRSSDNVTYETVTNASDRAVMGTATSVLGDFAGGNVFDEINTLTVDVGDGQLSSSTRTQLITGDVNALLVGEEIIQFRDASLVGSGVYLLKGFLRGRRGSEWAQSGHASDERVVLLQATGLRRIQDQAADIGISHYWKAVTVGLSPARATPQQFTDTGVGLKPFAPVDISVARDGFGGTSFGWHRRTRLAHRFLAAGIDAPLGEATEAYDVELYNASDVLVDSETVSDPEYTTTGFVSVGSIAVPVFGLRTIGGNRYAVNAANSSIVKLDASGAVLEETANLGSLVALCDNGTSFWVISNEFAPAPPLVPPSLSATKVYKFTPGSFATPDATYTHGGTLGDLLGIAHDGTNVWVTERSTNLLRKLNASTLASVATYAITGATTFPACVVYLSSTLWLGCHNGEVVKWDIGTLAEVARYSAASAIVGSISDLVVNGNIIVAQGSLKVATLATSSGTLLHTLSDRPPYSPGAPGRLMSAFGSYVVVLGNSGVNDFLDFIDAATGASAFQVATPFPRVGGSLETFAIGGPSSTYIVITGGLGSVSVAESLLFDLSPDLAGFRLVVYQKSAAVGRGYPATLEL